MTQIKPTYVTFEQAKKLKEKGFDSDYTNHCYDVSGNIRRATVTNKWIDEDGGYYNTVNVVTAPEQWQVIEWLRVVHGIWIHIYYLTEEKCWGWDCYRYEKENGLLNEPAISFKMNLKSPQEAYSSAFDYVLNNLI